MWYNAIRPTPHTAARGGRYTGWIPNQGPPNPGQGKIILSLTSNRINEYFFVHCDVH